MRRGQSSREDLGEGKNVALCRDLGGVWKAEAAQQLLA